MNARHRLLTAVVGVAAIASALVPAAYAEDPTALDAGYVTDHANVLSDSQEQTLEADLKTSAAAGIEVFVVYVGEFTNPADAERWARETADKNNLGPRQMLLAVATDARAFYLAEHVDSTLSASQITNIENEVTLPYLRNDDWAGAAKATGEAVAAAYTKKSSGSGGSIVPYIIGGTVIAGGGGLLIYGITRSRKKAKAGATDSSDPYAGMTDDELSKRAGSALVSADDSITSSKEELSFAAAQFGQGAVDKFQGVVDEAEADVQAAFRLQQQLDDDVPDTREQQRAWWIEIIGLCEQAEALIESNTEAFDALRELEKNAPQALATVETQLGQLEHSATTVAPELASLAQAYAPAVLETVRENPDHIRERITLAKNQVAEAKKFLAASDTGEAAFAIRTAEEGVFQGRQLVEAVTKLRNDLATADSESRALMADIQGDIASTSTIPGSSDLAPIVQATQGELARAASALDGASRNPVLALEALTAANDRIDTAIAEARTKAEREARAQQVLQSTMTNARAQIGAATDFINTRRGRVGSTARTRLAEASAAYNQAVALYPSSAEQALGYANRALQLANEAIQHANNDINYSGGGWGGGGGGSMSGDILGGIIGGIISGGGGSRSGGYRGGGSWGGSSSGGGFRTSGFGGGGGFRGGGGFSSGSRGGGGRF